MVSIYICQLFVLSLYFNSNTSETCSRVIPISMMSVKKAIGTDYISHNMLKLTKKFTISKPLYGVPIGQLRLCTKMRECEVAKRSGESAKMWRRCTKLRKRECEGAKAKERYYYRCNALHSCPRHFAISPSPFLIALSKSRSSTYNLMQATYSHKVYRFILGVVYTHVLGHRTYYEFLLKFYCVMLHICLPEVDIYSLSFIYTQYKM